MRLSFAVLAITALTSPAFADCSPNTETILSCTFQNGKKTLEACHDGTTAYYSFGKRGMVAEMNLKALVKNLNFEPWPGVGSSIWEQVTFTNEDISYVVWSSLTRDPTVAKPQNAGIEVMQGDKSLALLRCDQSSINTNIDQLWEAMEAQGMCYNRSEFNWQECD